ARQCAHPGTGTRDRDRARVSRKRDRRGRGLRRGRDDLGGRPRAGGGLRALWSSPPRGPPQARAPAPPPPPAFRGARAPPLGGTPRAVRMLLANERPFLLWAGTGLDARIMGNTRPALKRWFGRAGIFLTVAYEFFRYEFPRLEVTVDGVAHPATFAVICH